MWLACQRASWEPREPMRMGFFGLLCSLLMTSLGYGIGRAGSMSAVKQSSTRGEGVLRARRLQAVAA